MNIEYNKDISLDEYTQEELKNICNKIADKEIMYDYDILAIRCIEPEYLRDFRNSTVWEDGKKFDEELGGVSSVNTKVTYKDDAETAFQKIIKALNRAKRYCIYGAKPYLIVGKDAWSGEDTDEVIISDPVLLDDFI